MNMTTPQDDGEPAQTQPQEEYMAMMREANSLETKERNLRDWFAGMALQGVIAGSGHPMFDDDGGNQGQAQDSIQQALTDGPGRPELESNSTCSTWAWIAYCTADAMLAARKGDV